ncbi:hypothetical protein CFR73_02030 [Novacetimonas maltaceti]|uniref:Uncharacterized protein n=1 Tax=Novacetimonas maltaceti TaxID=1203393 RepID=A0A2S3W4P2_9PROT|nr:hypothetical protein [Novacetimonas maltaceti]POF63831.1 hypothetical protein KMAL_05890 [Novacetimonas maltaceti]PYD61830.1 hypothetical protein CFR73_02030 [Novacetimonas maltaceti]
MKQHKVMLGERVLYQAAQLSHAERFAAARRAEGLDCHVVPDTTTRTKRVRINSITGKPYSGRSPEGRSSDKTE